MKVSCKDCKIRYGGCHAECGPYLAFRAAKLKEYEKRANTPRVGTTSPQHEMIRRGVAR